MHFALQRLLGGHSVWTEQKKDAAAVSKCCGLVRAAFLARTLLLLLTTFRLALSQRALQQLQSPLNAVLCGSQLTTLSLCLVHLQAPFIADFPAVVQ